MVVFIIMFCGSIFLMFNVKVGLDQELAMPQVGSPVLLLFQVIINFIKITCKFTYIHGSQNLALDVSPP